MKLNMYIKTADEPLFQRLRTEAEVRGLSVSSALAEAVRQWLGEPDPIRDLTERLERIETRLTPEFYIDDDHPVAQAIRSLDEGRVTDLRRGGPHLLA